MNDYKDQETQEREGVQKTSEQLAAECDAFFALGNKPKQVDNMGAYKPNDVEKITSGWIAGIFPRNIAKVKAEKLGINFKLIIAEKKKRTGVAS